MKKSEISYQLYVLGQLWEWFVDAIIFPIVCYIAVFTGLYLLVSFFLL